jgi:hypothetical protein
LPNRPRGDSSLQKSSLVSRRSSDYLFFLSYSVGIEGKEEPEANLLIKPSLPLVVTPAAALDPQSPFDVCWHPRTDPACQRPALATPRCPAIAMPAVGTPAGPGRHRPPKDLSLRRQTQLDMRNQFPESVLHERGRRPCPNLVSATPSGSPARPERTPHSGAPTPRPTPLHTHTCTASCCQTNATLALPSCQPDRPRRAQVQTRSD